MSESSLLLERLFLKSISYGPCDQRTRISCLKLFVKEPIAFKIEWYLSVHVITEYKSVLTVFQNVILKLCLII